MATELEPLPGFDWGKVAWSSASARPVDGCSYCSETIDDDTVPLILWDARGNCARFCEACMARWWGML